MNAAVHPLLGEYGSYHVDSRNRALHEIGVPLIVLSIAAALARVHLGPVDAAEVAIVAVTVFYLTIDPRAATIAFFGLLVLYVIGWYVDLRLAIALFVAGWVLQFLGHAYEGRKPAFLTNAVHLLVAPLWISTLVLRQR